MSDSTEKNDFITRTNQGKTSVIFVKKTIDSLLLQINYFSFVNVINNQ